MSFFLPLGDQFLRPAARPDGRWEAHRRACVSRPQSPQPSRPSACSTCSTAWAGAPRPRQHGIRAAFKTWAAEQTNHAREVVELCLSHVQGNPLERARQRGDIIEKRRQLMQAGADDCEKGAQVGGNVVPLRE
jgi:hypothetical protein